MFTDKKWCDSTVQLDNQLPQNNHWQVQCFLTVAVCISTDPKCSSTWR